MRSVQALTEGELPDVASVGSLRDQQLVTLLVARGPLSGNLQHVTFHGHVDGVAVDTGQVELDDERIPAAIGVHRHRHGPAAPGPLGLAQPLLHLSEGVEAHEHRFATSFTLVVLHRPGRPVPIVVVLIPRTSLPIPSSHRKLAYVAPGLLDSLQPERSEGGQRRCPRRDGPPRSVK